MHAALHANDGNIANFADDKLTGMADRGRLREVRNFFIRDARGVFKFIGKCAESRSENERDFGSKLRLRQNKFRRARSLLKLARPGCLLFSHVYSGQPRKRSEERRVGKE